MGAGDKFANKVQDAKGRVKETVGRATGNRDLEAEGHVDQVKAAAKDVGEKVKDVAKKVTNTLHR